MADYATARLEVWLYNADPSTGYQILPMAGENSPGVASGTTGRATVDSGYAEATLLILGSKSDFPDLVPRRRVEFYACYTSRITGLPRKDLLHQCDIDRVLPLKNDNRYLKVTLIGLWSEAGRQPCLKRYALPQVSDKSVVFADLASRFVATGRLSDVQVQALPVGADIIYYDAYGSDGVGVPFSRAAADLAQDVGMVATGADVSPSGQRRIFFRPFDDLTQPARHTLTLPSQRIGQTQDEDDVSGQATVLQIVGGAAYYPNLLAPSAQGNTTFNDPQIPSDSSSNAANLVTNPSFEDGDESSPTHWSLQNGASAKEDEDQVAAFNGKRYLKLDHIGECAVNGVNPFAIAQPTGATLTLDCRARLGNETKGATGELRLRWLDVSGNTVSTSVLPLTPARVNWDLFAMNVTVPAGATGAELKPICTAKPAGYENDTLYALLVDEVRLYNATGVTQKGWSDGAYGGTVFNALNWYDETAPWLGGSSVYIDVSGATDNDSHDAVISPDGDTRFPVLGGQTFIAGVVMQVVSGAGPLQLQVFEWEEDGSSPPGDPLRQSFPLTPSGWAVYAVEKGVNQPGKECEFKIVFRGDCVVRIGAVFCIDKGALPSGYTSISQIVDPGKPEQFTQGDRFVTTVRADTLFAPGDPVHDAAVLLGDIITQEQHSEIVAQADAETYARTWFAKNVPVLTRINLDAFGVIETGDPDPVTGIAPSTATMMPGESIRLLGEDGMALMPNPLPLYEKEWTWTGGMLTIKPYIQAAPRDPSRTLVDFIRKLQAQGIIPMNSVDSRSAPVSSPSSTNSGGVSDS